MNNKDKLNLSKNGNTNIDKKILPLFSRPIQLKQTNLIQTNKYNFNILNPQNQINKTISLREILSIYLKGINVYNLNLNTYLKNNNKLKLIRELKYDEYNKLNIKYNNYLYLINRYLPILKLRSLFYNLGLFSDKRILKHNILYAYTYRLRSIYLNKRYKYFNIKRFYIDNKIININIKMVSKLLQKGLELNNEINSLILKKKYLIGKLKLNNLFVPVNNIIINILDNKSVEDKIKTKKEKKNNYDLLLNLNEIKLNKTFHSITKNNEINIKQTRESILNYYNFDKNIDALPLDINTNRETIYNNSSSPIEIMYYNNNQSINNKLESKPIINQYLKEMSKFNKNKKGIFIYYNNLIGFNFNSNTNKLIKNIYKLLQASFKSMYCLISKPVFIITPDKIIIQLFYYSLIPNILKLKKLHKLNTNVKYNKLIKFNNRKKFKLIKKQYSKFRKIKFNLRIKLRKLSNITLTKIFFNKFKILCDILSNLFKKPVELNLIRLHYPYNDSNILVTLLGIMINKIKLRMIIRRLFEKAVIKNLNKVNLNRKVNIIPAFLSGINIKVAGRLMTQKVIPRITVKNTRRGASARGKVNYLDVARYTNKNKRGAFSITIKAGQNYF